MKLFLVLGNPSSRMSIRWREEESSFHEGEYDFDLILQDHFQIRVYSWIFCDLAGEEIPELSGRYIANSVSDILRVRDEHEEYLGDNFSESMVKVDVYSAFSLQKYTSLCASDFFGL